METYGAEADGPEAVLAALDPEQREVALATRGPVCVLAGAGTGTRQPWPNPWDMRR